MDKKVVIISASLRKDSNSEQLAKAFAQGAERAGNEIEFISLSGKNWDSVPGVCPVRKRSVAICRTMRQSLPKR